VRGGGRKETGGLGWKLRCWNFPAINLVMNPDEGCKYGYERKKGRVVKLYRGQFQVQSDGNKAV